MSSISFKHTLVIFLSIICFGCLSRCDPGNESIATLGEYDIPLDSKAHEMIYTYVDKNDDDTLVVRYLAVPNGSGWTLSQYNSTNDMLRYERYYSISGGRKKLTHEYRHEYPSETSSGYERVEGEIVTFHEIRDGNRYPGLKIKIIFTNSINFRTVLEETSTYAGDTVLMWDNQKVDAIKFYYENSNKTFIKYLPFRNAYYEHKGASYYAKGIGLVKFTAVSEGERASWELISIRKL